jgi:hypothetical protein
MKRNSDRFKKTYPFWLGLEKDLYLAKGASHQEEIKLELFSTQFQRKRDFFHIFYLLGFLTYWHCTKLGLFGPNPIYLRVNHQQTYYSSAKYKFKRAVYVCYSTGW